MKAKNIEVSAGQVKLKGCNILGVYVIEPTIHNDERGYFFESYNESNLAQVGINLDFVQDNESSSVKGVLRGLHFQKKYPQAKLVRVTEGMVYDVAVDIRKESETYGQWFGTILSAENKAQLYIDAGLAHGFLVLSEKMKLKKQRREIIVN